MNLVHRGGPWTRGTLDVLYFPNLYSGYCGCDDFYILVIDKSFATGTLQGSVYWNKSENSTQSGGGWVIRRGKLIGRRELYEITTVY